MRTAGYPIKFNTANTPEIEVFSQEKGFIEESRFYYYFFFMQTIQRLSHPSKGGPYQAQKATMDDLPAICVL